MMARAALLGLLLPAVGVWAGPPTLVGASKGNLQAWHVRLRQADSNACVAGFMIPQSFQVFAVTNPVDPSYRGGIFFNHSGERLSLSGDGLRAVMASYTAGLRVIALTNPAIPVAQGLYNNGGSHPRDVVLSRNGRLAYVADESAGIEVISLDNPASPVRIGQCTNGFGGGSVPAGLALNPAETLLLVVAEGGGLKVIDVAMPSVPILVGEFPLPSGSGPMFAVTTSADGTRAYTAGGGGTSEAGLHILSITNPASPTLLASLTDPIHAGELKDLVLSSDESTVFLVGPGLGLRVVDVSLVTSAVYVAEFYEVINDVEPQATGVDLSANDALAYIAEGINGLRVVDLSGVYDIDDDGLPNAWELRYFNSLTGALPGADSDGDGVLNNSEYAAGSNPRDSNSVFRVTAVAAGPPVQVVVPSLVGRRYDLLAREDLALTDAWQAVAASTDVPGTGTNLFLGDASAFTQRFYRVTVRLGP